MILDSLNAAKASRLTLEFQGKGTATVLTRLVMGRDAHNGDRFAPFNGPGNVVTQLLKRCHVRPP